MFSATILRPLTSTRNYATIATRKSKDGELLKICQNINSILIKSTTLKKYFLQFFQSLTFKSKINPCCPSEHFRRQIFTICTNRTRLRIVFLIQPPVPRKGFFHSCRKLFPQYPAFGLKACFPQCIIRKINHRRPHIGGIPLKTTAVFSFFANIHPVRRIQSME